MSLKSHFGKNWLKIEFFFCIFKYFLETWKFYELFKKIFLSFLDNLSFFENLLKLFEQFKAFQMLSKILKIFSSFFEFLDVFKKIICVVNWSRQKLKNLSLTDRKYLNFNGFVEFEFCKEIFRRVLINF